MDLLGRWVKTGVIVLALTAIGWAARTDAGAIAPRHVTIFDDRSGLQFTLQARPEAVDPGKFRFRIPGLGVYEANAGPAMRVHSATSVVINFTGNAVLSPLVTLRGVTGTVVAPSTRTIEVQAQVDPEHHTGQVQLIDGGTRYHLVASAAARSGLVSLLGTFEASFQTSDWESLYDLMNTDVRAEYTRASFAAFMTSQVAAEGAIRSMVRSSVGEIVSSDAGATYVPVTYLITIETPEGTTRIEEYVFYFIRQMEGWTFWGSSEASSGTR